jgi:sulfonate transport system permease protein
MGDSRRRPLGWVVPLAVIAAWQVLDDTGVVAFEFLPAPRAIGRALSDVVWSGELAGHLLHTAGITVLAALLALATGGALGLGVGLLPRLRINVLASIDVLRTVPAVSLMPIALLALGPAPVTELLLATWAAQWAIVVNISGGVRGIPERHYDVARMLRLTRAETLRTVVVPAVVPAAMVGMRLAVIVALHVTITAEMVMVPAGLGGAMVRAMQTLDVDRLWAYAVACGVLGAAVNSGLRRLVAGVLPGSPAHHRIVR